MRSWWGCNAVHGHEFRIVGGSKSPRRVGPHNPQSDARLLEEEEAPGRARAQFIQFCLLGKGKSVEFKLLPSLLRRRRWRRRWRWWRFLMGQILLEGAKKQPEHTVVQGSRHRNQTALCYFHRLPSADQSLVVELNKIPACPRPPWPPWRCVACSSLPVGWAKGRQSGESLGHPSHKKKTKYISLRLHST